MRVLPALLTAALGAGACRTAAPSASTALQPPPGLLAPVDEEPPTPAPDAPAEDAADGDGPVQPREADPRLDTGIVLRSFEGGDWGLRLSVPVTVALNDFDLEDLDELSLDALTTLSAVPTFELVFPVDEHWTILPFAGLGLALLRGDDELVGGQDVLGLQTGGLRATRWERFAGRYWTGITGEVDYTAALSGRNTTLGDWGRVHAALELRRDFGSPGPDPRFQGGVYVQGIAYWLPPELDIDGVTPQVVEDHVELGVSLGTTEPWKLWIFRVPRVFVGAFFGENISGARIRFGRL